MKPIAPLMVEHRLIERMLALFQEEHDTIANTGNIDREFLEAGIDFFRNYVDNFHHGKEENILFSELEKKPLSSEDRTMLNGLIEDHVRTRAAIAKLDETRRHLDDPAKTEELLRNMQTLIKWYPVHIDKEDKHFFIPAMNYFSGEEQASMLERSREFDRNFMQHRYSEIIKNREGKASASKAA